jgi:hypothetical protein
MTEAEKLKLEPLTAQQIENWRKAMSVIIGPYALIMPISEIEDFRRNLQEKANAQKP